MKTRKFLWIWIALPLVFAGCDANFEELEQNLNRPAEVPPGVVLNGVLNDLYMAPWSLEHRQNQFWCCNYNYYGTNEYWTNASLNYQSLKNVVKMEDEAKRTGAGDINPYSALGKFFRAYFLVRMTQKVGDVPMTESLMGLGNTQPAYDPQKQIYLSVLNYLDAANADLATLIAANDLTLAGDFMNGNSLVRWQKVVNAFTLRVLVSLSKKEADPELNVKGRFAAIVNSPGTYPLLTGNGDNMSYIYNGTTNLYPTNPGNRGFDKNRYNMAYTYVNLLTTLQDPRVFVVANPAKKKLTDGVPANSFAAFVGADSGISLDSMTTMAQAGEYSYANQKRYYGTYAGPEPGVMISYAEQCFNIAEGINRAWTTGSAATYYTEGITASMSFYGIQNGTVIRITEQDNDTEVGTFTVNLPAYLAQPSVQYAGDNATGLQQILKQKYLAFFQNSGQEAYFNYRRTGIPAFLNGPGTGNGGIIPTRWLYPIAEKTNNNSNYSAAVTSQFGSSTESLNDVLWLEKP